MADQSAQAADRIRGIVDEVQQQSHQTLEHGEETDAILQLQEQTVERAVEAFNNIDEYVNRLNKALSDIIEETKSIEVAKNSTLEAVEGISAVIEENSASNIPMPLYFIFQ